MTPKALVITAPGINCDLELAQAFSSAGAEFGLTPLVFDSFAQNRTHTVPNSGGCSDSCNTAHRPAQIPAMAL